MKKNRKEREKEELIKKRRLEIINAAMSLFDKKGIQNVTLSMIAKEIELTKAAVYLYFRSKEDLLFSLLVEMATETWFITEELPENLTGWDFLKLIIQSAKDGFSENLIFKHIVMNFDQLFIDNYPETLDSACRWRELNAGGLDTLTAIIQRCRDEGSVKKEIDARETAAMIGNVFTILGGTASVRRKLLIDEQGADPYQEFCNLLDIILEGLRA